jgi:hypothetical protein
LVAAAVFLGIWTVLGGGVRDLGVAIDELWRLRGADGELTTLGPSPGAAIGAGLVSLGYPLTLLGLMGSLIPKGSRQRRISWFVVATVLLAGGLNGSLHEPRASLMLFSLPFIAVLALEGPLLLWKRSST